MTWLKLVPWKLVAMVGGGLVLLLLYRHELRVAQDRGYARAVAENAAALADAQQKVITTERRAKEADEHARQSKTEELAAVRAEYAARPDRVIRVCVSPPRDYGAVPGGGSGGGSGRDGATAAGALQAGAGPDPVAVFDPAELYALMRQADEVVAECRALQGRLLTRF